MNTFVVILNIALNLIAGSFAGSPGNDVTNLPRPSCYFLEFSISDYPLRDIVLYYEDINGFVNTHSVSYDVYTSIKEYTANVLSSQTTLAEDKNSFLNYVTSYVRNSINNMEMNCFDGIMKNLIPGWPDYSIPTPSPP